MVYNYIKLVEIKFRTKGCSLLKGEGMDIIFHGSYIQALSLPSSEPVTTTSFCFLFYYINQLLFSICSLPQLVTSLTMKYLTEFAGLANICPFTVTDTGTRVIIFITIFHLKRNTLLYHNQDFLFPSGTITPVPDTQELCRRLEEKINSLTRMGGNLVKENKGLLSLHSFKFFRK